MSGLKIKHAVTVSSQGKRTQQEDHASVQVDRGLFVIADGFGGGTAGSSAAKLSCESVLEFLLKEAGDLDATLPFVLKSYYSLAGNIVFNSVLHANRKVIKSNSDQSANQKGGASLLAGYMDGGFLALANVGVCSAWLVRDGEIAQIAKPRSYSTIRNPHAIDDDPGTSVPMMAVGITETLEPEIFECQVRAGDWLILQTDGISSVLRNKIKDLYGSGLDQQKIQKQIEALLKSESNSDNSTISLVIF